MIYTLTMNPSIDYIMELESLNAGTMNRSRNSYILPGGKGINVSSVLNALGAENTAILPVAGFTGEKLLALLEEKGIRYDAIKLEKGDTRINVKVLAKEETELNAKGPEVSKDALKELYKKTEYFKAGDVFILSGSVPGEMGSGFYKELIAFVRKNGVEVILDTIGEAFLKGLSEGPFLVKPNKEELEEAFQTEANTEDELVKLAKKVQDLGARNVLVSLGKEGAMLLTQEGEVLWQNAPGGKVINSVGAGDSMVAGFVAEYQKNGNVKMALKVAVAVGSASAFSKNLATKEEIDALIDKL